MHKAVLASALLALALLPQEVAHASAPYDPAAAVRAIVRRYVEATGGDSAFAADSVLHVKAKLLTQGMRGTWEYWRRGADELLEIENAGQLRSREGLDHDVAWRTDLSSRRVTPVEGKDLEAMRSRAWFLSEAWAREDVGGGKLEPGPAAFVAGRSMVSVVATPPVGPAATLWFDPQTGLLSRITHRRDQYSWNENFTDWKSLAGRKRWTTSRMGDSTISEVRYQRVNVDSVTRELPRTASGFRPPESQARPVSWLRTRGIARLPFSYRRGHVWVRASINGAPPREFILDTGCTMTAVDQEYAREAGLALDGHMVAQGVGGSEGGTWGRVRTLRISTGTGTKADGIEVPDLMVAALGLTEAVEKFEWDDTAGLIGYDVLSRFVVEFDFDRRIVSFFDPATWKYEGPGAPVPFVLHHGIPTIEVQLDSTCRGRFIVDVGNATVPQVHAKQVEQCRLFGTHHTKELRHWVGGIGGAFPETVCRLDSIRIGPFAWREPVTGLTQHKFGSSGSVEIQGNLGTSVLDRFVCTFDYARGTLWLAPGKRFAERDHFTRSGLWFLRYQGVVYVAAVVKKSPGEDAGLKVRDIVKAVDGKPIDRWTPEALEALFESGEPGRVVKLTYERELVDHTVDVTLADVL